MSALPQPVVLPRKPSQVAQYNWITESFDTLSEPEQLALELVADDVELPSDGTVSLLATENGSQLVISGFGLFVGKKSERVVIRHNKAVCAQVPFAKLQEIVIGSRGVSISSDLIEDVCARNVRLAFLTSSGRPFALLTSPLLTATVQTRKAQFAGLGTEVGAELCRWIVAGKLRNQEKLLLYFARTRPNETGESLRRAAASIRNLRKSALGTERENVDALRATLMGLEGTAGRIYWKQIIAILPDPAGFVGRVHRGSADGVNAALNYGYGILTAHVWGAVMNAGLEPFAGFLHVDRSGKPSLVLDLMEEFRQPVVDRAVLTWLTKGGRIGLVKGMLDGASKEEVAARVLKRLTTTEQHRGKQHEVRSIIQMQARLAASAVRGLRKYRPFSFTW